MTRQVPEHTRQLARQIHRPGGMTAEEAVTAAEQRLEGLRGRFLSDMATTIGAMQVLASAIDPGPDERRANELYRLSNSLVGVAGVFGMIGLSEVALSLCTLVEWLLLARRWDRSAVQLHLDSLRLLSRDSVSQAEIATVCAALRQVVTRLRSTTDIGQIDDPSGHGDESRLN